MNMMMMMIYTMFYIVKICREIPYMRTALFWVTTQRVVVV